MKELKNEDVTFIRSKLESIVNRYEELKKADFLKILGTFQPQLEIPRSIGIMAFEVVELC